MCGGGLARRHRIPAERRSTLTYARGAAASGCFTLKIGEQQRELVDVPNQGPGVPAALGRHSHPARSPVSR
jgi:hypothetical protein